MNVSINWIAVLLAAISTFLIGDGGLGFGVFAGIATGATFVAAAFGVTYLFERCRLALFYVNGSYAVVSFTAMGAIIGALQ